MMEQSEHIQHLWIKINILKKKKKKINILHGCRTQCPKTIITVTSKISDHRSL